jgi:hypothetical protein
MAPLFQRLCYQLGWSIDFGAKLTEDVRIYNAYPGAGNG